MTSNNEKLLVVKINHHGLIPLVGPGPIVVPTIITESAKETIEALIGKGKIVVLDEEEKYANATVEAPKVEVPVKEQALAVEVTSEVIETVEESTLEVTEEVTEDKTPETGFKKRKK